LWSLTLVSPSFLSFYFKMRVLLLFSNFFDTIGSVKFYHKVAYHVPELFNVKVRFLLYWIDKLFSSLYSLVCLLTFFCFTYCSSGNSFRRCSPHFSSKDMYHTRIACCLCGMFDLKWLPPLWTVSLWFFWSRTMCVDWVIEQNKNISSLSKIFIDVVFYFCVLACFTGWW
jgi:hypothetical protein